MIVNPMRQLMRDEYLARATDDGFAIATELDTARHEFSARGVLTSGAWVTHVTGVAGQHMRKRCESGVTVITRTCDSYGISPSREALADVWDEIVTTESLFEICRVHLLLAPNPAGAIGDLRGTLDAARLQGRTIAIADLAHYAAVGERKRKARVIAILGWIGAALAGGFITQLLTVAAKALFSAHSSS